ncbi:MAG: glycogen debranching enzyme GlgX [Brevundimonas sp.]|nr:MAG: glycogen debranching enzyme GlgX [Brevundimonas sp.]
MTPSLGAHLVEGGTRFAVRSPDADQVWLCLFHGDEEQRVPMEKSGDDWIIDAAVGVGQAYGYRAAGAGPVFDPAKLLVDPYALELDRRYRQDTRLAIHGEETGDLVPRALVTAPFDGAPSPPLFRPGGLIYELNVRGFTMRHPDVPEGLRGTLAALAQPVIIEHLQKLRVSAVELMPITAWIDERHLPPRGLSNAWGYNPVTPMALDPRLVPGGVEELRATVAALREAGIGVILDLVFNHTGESDAHGPTLSLRGLDDAAYARAPDGSLINDAGTGNVLDASRPSVREMILDSLRHFARCGVDGFRFDLATVMARGPGFDPSAPIFAEIAGDPLLADRVMIAEPWDIGPGGYQLGAFPKGWLEWNDRYRDDVRRFWRGDGSVSALATRLCGSFDVFDEARTRTVNFLATHDGFTLADLVAYEHRHNEANGEDNRDGHGENLSWNHGVEGPTDDPEILRRRGLDVRAMLATLFASRGTIQLTAGDEFGRSQQGNNNAYAQDNEVSWVDWTARDISLEAFVFELADDRAALPELSDPQRPDDIRWTSGDGHVPTQQQWASRSAEGLSMRTGSGGGVTIASAARSLSLVVPQV